MKLTFRNLAAVALLSCLAIISLATPDLAHAATLLDISSPGEWVGELSMANLAAIAAQRSEIRSLRERAASIDAEIVDGLDDEAVRAIEVRHADAVRQIEEAEAELDRMIEEADDSAGDDQGEQRSELTAAQAADIMSIGRRANMSVEDVENAVRSNISVEDFRTRAFEHMATAAEANQPEPQRGNNVRITQDEQETRNNAMSEAMSYRFGTPLPEAGPSDAARQFMDYRSLSSFVADTIGFEGRIDSVRALDELYERAAHSTSDFSAIFEGALNTTLEAQYMLAQPTFRRIARRSDFSDFRPHTTVKLGDFPMLEKVAENGEIKYGTFNEGKETVQAFAYAKALSISRNMLINDRLDAIGELLSSYGQTVALFEEIMFYSSALNGKLADGKAVYHADHSNLAASGSAISIASVSVGRQSMSEQKSLDKKPLLSNAPRILLCGPKKLTEAEQLLATISPAVTGNVNPFSGKLDPLETAQITGNEWYLLPDASAGQASNYRWGYLDGYEAPRIRMDEPFGRQGMAMSVEHDFGVGSTDSRHGYKNPGNS